MKKLIVSIFLATFIGATNYANPHPIQTYIAQRDALDQDLENEDLGQDAPMQNEINDQMAQDVQQEQNIQQGTIAKVDATGTMITLQNGSVWKIAEVDRYNSINWQPGDRITIQATGAYSPPYQLTNTVNRSQTQPVDTCGAEMVQGPGTHNRQ
ncbi:MAG TPA: hypothetical protein VN457_05725 [Chlamydiales bacterium]|nr:hypothetical protein [Chlamydiales bacterium]